MLAKLSVKKPYTVGVGIILILLLGGVSFSNMTVDLLPSIDLPYMMVTTTYPGASPEKVESAITKPLEQTLSTTTGLEEISSISSENASVIMLAFNESTNMDAAMIEISEKVDSAEGSFEEGVLSPIVMKLNPDMMPIMMLSVDLEGMTIEEMSHYVEEVVMPRFERIEGVAAISPVGLIKEEVTLEIDPIKIQNLNNQLIGKIDDELAVQEQNLNTAKNEIGNIKNQLTAEESKQLAQLDEGLHLLEQTKQGLSQLIAASPFSKEELGGIIAEREASYNEKQRALLALEETLESLEEDALDYPIIQTEIEALQEEIAQMEIELAGLREAGALFTQYDELLVQEEELRGARQLLINEFDKAENELDKQAGQLQSASGALEEVREEAYGMSDIGDQLTVDMVGNLLKAQHFSMPAGYVEEGGTRYVVKVGDLFKSVDEIRGQLLLNMEGVGDITVNDVANVTITNNKESVYTNINGNPGVVLSFQKASAYSTAEVTQAVREEIQLLSKENDAMSITTLSDQGIYIELIVQSVLNNLIIGGILAVIVLIFFLRSIKTTLIVALSIPISVLFAIVLMYFSDVTLNIISLSGLALGVGMLVDNSIVVMENIFRLRSEGVNQKEAAIKGAQQVSGAIFASTLTTICVFLPIVFTEGMSRALFVDMGLTIGYSLIASFIIAITAVPAMGGSFLRNVKVMEKNPLAGFVTLYEKLLVVTLRRKWLILISVTGLFAFTVIYATQMGTGFIPSMESSQMTLTLSTEGVEGEADLYGLSDELMTRLMTIEAIETVGALEESSFSMMGSGGGVSDEMLFYVILDRESTLSNSEVESLIYERTSDMEGMVQVSGSSMDLGALGGSGVELMVKGLESDVLLEIAKDMGDLLRGIEGTIDIVDGTESTGKELRIIVDKNKAAANGIAVASVYQSVATALREETTISQLTMADKNYPMVAISTNDLTREGLMNREIEGRQGEEVVSIKIGDLATIEEGSSLMSIRHDQQSRYMTVTAAIDKGYNIGLVSRVVEQKLADYDVPQGYTIEVVGENLMIQEAMGDLASMLLLAISFVYLIMVAQFQSLRSPFIVMFTIPLAFTGGLLALILTGGELTVISILGFLVLSGIIVNNGIVFVDYVNQLRGEGKPKKEAIIEAGKTRMRPIVMTALTTILAMSTMAIGIGEGSEMTQGLAIVTIGGLIYGTLLTLIVIPVLYDLFTGKEQVVAIARDNGYNEGEEKVISKNGQENKESHK